MKKNVECPPEALLSHQPEGSRTTETVPVSVKDAKDPDLLEGALKEALPKVEKMERRQKEIEEENKKKRKLLLDTINERLLEISLLFPHPFIFITYSFSRVERNKLMPKKRNWQ